MNEHEPKLEFGHESPADKVVRLRKEVEAKVDRGFSMSQTLISFVDNMREKYPDWKEHLVYHLLVGSSPSGSDKEKMIYEDFPGEGSVVSFLESILKGEK